MATNKPTPAAADPSGPVAALRIVAHREPFYRCGIKFGLQPTDVLLSTLQPEQVKRLKAEPMLVVSEVEVDGPKAKAKAEPAPAAAD